MKTCKFFITLLALAFCVTASPQGFDPTPPDDPQTPVFPEDPVVPVTYSFSVVAQNPQAAYVSGTGQYEVGTAVRVSTSARSNRYTFSHWASDGDIISREASFIYVTTNADVTLTAVYDFTPSLPVDPQTPVIHNKHVLNLVCEPADVAAFNRVSGDIVREGTAVALDTWGNQNYVFQGWYLGDTPVSMNANFYYVMPDADVTLIARFVYQAPPPFDPATPDDPFVDWGGSAPFTIRANDITITYGSQLPTLGFSSDGGEPDGMPVLTCEASATSPVGTYPIIIKRGTVKNMNVAFVGGTLTIEPAPLTIRANDISIIQGETLPELSYSIEGFRNGDTEATITLPEISCRANGQSAVGTYPITLSGGDALNYDIKLVNGTLTVGYAPVIVSANNITMTYGDEVPELSFTTEGANFEGEPALSCTATSSSPVGTYPIMVSQGTIDNTNCIFVAGTLTIVKAPLTITAKDAERFKYDSNPEFELTFEGFRNEDTEADITLPMISCAANEQSAVGTYPITLNGGDALNYNLQLVNGTLTVGYAPVIITANDVTITYGDEVPELTYSSEGANFEGVPELTCAATSASPVGAYPIVVSQGTIDNINCKFVVGTLTIIKAPLTITVKDAERFKYNSNPEFELTFDGFRNGDTKSNITLPTISCAANEQSAVGTYPITLSGGEAQNYDLKFVNGTLTVRYSAVTVTANDMTMTYGDEVPTFTFSSEGANYEGEPELTCTATSASPVGTYPIVVTQGSMDNTNSTFVAGTLTITKASLTITAKDAERYLGNANPKFELIFDGLLNGDTSSDISLPTISCEANEASAVGTYPIILSGGEALNYNLKLVNGTLTVGYAPVTITANDLTITYGDEVPELSFTTEGANFEGVPILTCTATSSSPAGTYPIVVSQGTIDNTNSMFISGTLTITKAPLTITVKDAEREEGIENPEFELIYEGFRNNDTEADITIPTISCEADEQSAPGSYDIILSGGYAQNYELTLVPGVMTVMMKDGIGTVNGNTNLAKTVYDMSGRPVSVNKARRQKGLYITAGKKQLIINK